MRGYSRIRAALTGLAASVVVAAGTAAAAPATAGTGATNVRSACPQTTQVRCFAEVRTDVHGGFGVRGAAARSAADRALPAGYGPATLRAAYRLPAGGGRGQTVAVVDAGDDKTAEADLGVYRSTYGLPACTTANGCFTKVNQNGATSPLPPDQGWGVEISLDLDMVSAACPGCHILLVEADAPTFDALATAVNTAARLGATEISNSYGASEQNGMQTYESAYSHRGVAVVASSGDYGYGIPNFPAVFSSVIAVGGTSLTPASNSRGWAETVWNSGGGAAASGCSAWIAKPTWQKDPNCPGRTVADVSADADPNTGPAVYDAYDGLGWGVVGGTSAASPFIAGVIGLAGNPAALPNASHLYSHAAGLFDVVGGTNVIPGFLFGNCGEDYLCTAVKGYDGPTGLGTPNGTAAF